MRQLKHRNSRTLYLACSFFLFIVAFSSCSKNTDETDSYYEAVGLQIPMGFPVPAIPEGNEINSERLALGRRLFFDKVMSRDYSISCASCHLPEFAFSDTVAISPGVEGRIGFRNAPPLLNVAYLNAFMREGGVPSLEQQVLAPIQDHAEFDFNILLIAERLNEDSSYVQMSLDAYERLPDPYVITRALACFQRSLIGGQSAYDKYFFQDQPHALSASELRGLTLFESEELACQNCHSGFLFTDESFRNTGLYEVYADSGRARLTYLPSDRGLFKVPSLRNVSITAPYMHDGSLQSLDAVIEHYANGGANHENKDELIKGFDLSPAEREDLINFLHALEHQP